MGNHAGAQSVQTEPSSELTLSQEDRILNSDTEMSEAVQKLQVQPNSPTQQGANRTPSPSVITLPDEPNSQGARQGDPEGKRKNKGKRVSGSEARRRKREREAATGTPLKGSVQDRLSQHDTPKRQRDLGETPPDSKPPPPKKNKQANVSEVVKKSFLWRRLHREDGEPIVPEELETVRAFLDGLIMEGLLESQDKSPPPIFEGLRLINGSIVATCVNAHTAKWLEDRCQFFISILESPLLVGLLTPEMKPEPLFKAVFWLDKNAPLEAMKCLDILTRQNAGLDTSKWRIRSRYAQGNRVKVICSITKGARDYITSQHCRLHFLSGTAHVILEGNQPSKEQARTQPEITNRTVPENRASPEKPSQAPPKNKHKGPKAKGTNTGQAQGTHTQADPYITNFRNRAVGESREQVGVQSTTNAQHTSNPRQGARGQATATANAPHTDTGYVQTGGMHYASFPGQYYPVPYPIFGSGSGTSQQVMPNWFTPQQGPHTHQNYQGMQNFAPPFPTGQQNFPPNNPHGNQGQK